MVNVRVFDLTGLPWVNPSPNIRSLSEALLYPGIAMPESSPNYSVGRGTDAPFEQIGADWIRGKDLADYLTARAIPGVRVAPVVFTPTSSHFAGKTIEGAGFTVTNRDVFSSARLGLELAMALERLYPGKMKWDEDRDLIGSAAVIGALKKGGDATKASEDGMAAFQAIRRKYLLYR